MSASCETRTLTASDARRLVSLACRAPSMYNSQPWAWRIGPHSIALYADRGRQLPAADPDGRNLVIGCGAALHHFQVAARASGWAPSVTRFPDPGDPDLLAEILLQPEAATPRHAADLVALRSRSTDRRRFTSWPVPDERLVQLAEVATAWGSNGVPLLDVSDRFRVELLVSRALRLQERDASVAAEQRDWLDRRDSAGVPLDTVPVGTATVESHRSRFGHGSLADHGRDIESTDGLVVLCDDSDDPAAWLRAGEGLSALWLHALGEGLSVVPLTQLIEVPETRNALQHDVFGGLVVPLLLVRIGWQAIGRSQLSRTPRRPVDEVLVS